MESLKVKILSTTDSQHLGTIATTDMHSISVGGKDIDISGRLHRGDGKWRLWNSNYVLEVEEVDDLTTFGVGKDGKVKSSKVSRSEKKRKV